MFDLVYCFIELIQKHSEFSLLYVLYNLAKSQFMTVMTHVLERESPEADHYVSHTESRRLHRKSKTV